MKDIKHASINGVEIRNLAELDDDENLLYSGELWLGGNKVGTFHEDLQEGIKMDINPEFEEEFGEKIDSYLNALTEGTDEELPPETFAEDLIELEIYLQKFKEGLAEGYGCLLVNYREDGGVDVYSVESEDDVEEIARDNNLTDFQTFYEFDHFIIDC